MLVHPLSPSHAHNEATKPGCFWEKTSSNHVLFSFFQLNIFYSWPPGQDPNQNHPQGPPPRTGQPAACFQEPAASRGPKGPAGSEVCGPGVDFRCVGPAIQRVAVGSAWTAREGAEGAEGATGCAMGGVRRCEGLWSAMGEIVIWKCFCWVEGRCAGSDVTRR